MKNNLKIRNIVCFIVFVCMNFFILTEFLLRKNIVNPYNAATFFISYKNGFISRGFIGTIMDFIPPKEYLFVIPLVTGIMVIIFTAFLLTQVFHIFFEQIEENTCYWFLFMMCSSTVIHFCFRHSHTKMDLFWYVLFIPVFLSFLDFKKKKVRNIIFLFSLSIISILIHQAFIFVIVPFILVLLWDTEEKKIMIPYMITVGIVFLCCQFLGKGNFQLIAEEVYEKTSLAFANDKEYAWAYIRRMLYLEYNMSVFEHFKVLKKEFFNVNLRLFFLTYFCNFLNIAVLIKMFIYTFKSKAKLYLPFLCLTQLPLYLLTIDYERWTTFFLLNLQLLIVYRLRKGEKVNTEEPPKYMSILFIANIVLIIFMQFRFGIKME